MKPLKLAGGLLLFTISLLMLFAACTSTPSQQPTSLQVTRVVNNPAHKNLSPKSWTITDANAVQQLFDDIHNLPTHHNNGADSCGEPFYSYHLNFFKGTTSIEKDDLYTYCGTLSSANVSYDPTPDFNTHFAQMLHVSPNDLTGWHS